MSVSLEESPRPSRGPVKFKKERLSLQTLLHREVYWACPQLNCGTETAAAVEQCKSCGFRRTNSYEDQKLEEKNKSTWTRVIRIIPGFGKVRQKSVDDDSKTSECQCGSISNSLSDTDCQACGAHKQLVAGDTREGVSEHPDEEDWTGEGRESKLEKGKGKGKGTVQGEGRGGVVEEEGAVGEEEAIGEEGAVGGEVIGNDEKCREQLPVFVFDEQRSGLSVQYYPNNLNEDFQENPQTNNLVRNILETSADNPDIKSVRTSSVSTPYNNLDQDGSLAGSTGTRLQIPGAVSFHSLTFLNRFDSEEHELKCQSLAVVRQTDEDEAMAIWLRIVDEYKGSSSFIDPDFPHSNKSLSMLRDHPVTHWPVVGWQRPSEIKFMFVKQKWTVYKDPSPSDIAQGVLGNCWFLSALAAIAEIPELVQQIIITKEYCKEGVYQLRLCIDGLWKVVILDDYFPCDYSGNLVFSKAKGNQLWVPLIEKGLAKLYGCYEALECGMVLEGLSVLTGYPCESIYLQSYISTSEIDEDLIWAKLLSFKESRFPMTASCGGLFVPEEEYKKMGLVQNHAYTVLNLKQDGSYRSVQLRNPWGGQAFSGLEYSPNTQRGEFWISLTDFFRYFTNFDVCKYQPGWHIVRSICSISPCAPVAFSPAVFTVTDTTDVTACLYQPTYRGIQATLSSQVDISMLIVELSSKDSISLSSLLPLPVSGVKVSNCQLASSVCCSLLLQRGRYAVLPLSFGHWQRENHKEDLSCVLGLFSGKVIQWEGHPKAWPGFLTKSIFCLAHKFGRIIQALGNCYVYQMSLPPAGYMWIAENSDRSICMKISLSFTCENMISTRGTFAISDTLPPMHRQVICVLTRRDAGRAFSFSYEYKTETFISSFLRQAEQNPPLQINVQELHRQVHI